MSRYYDRDVLRRAHQISSEQTRRGECGSWIGAHQQAYRERTRTPLERRIQREWGQPEVYDLDDIEAEIRTEESRDD